MDKYREPPWYKDRPAILFALKVAGILSLVVLVVFAIEFDKANRAKLYEEGAWLEPGEIHLVSASASGIVQTASFRPGDQVNEGDVLVEVLEEKTLGSSNASVHSIAATTVAIRAPISGTVMSSDVKVGQRIRSDATEPLLVLGDTSRLNAVIGIRPEKVHTVKPGMRVRFSTGHKQRDFVASGVVKSIDPRPVEFESPWTTYIGGVPEQHRITVEIDKSSERFMPGGALWAVIQLEE